ncbi:MAG: acetyltransferase [Anaerolineae bacterium]|nr:acetyltransferase [Anaerolineae bacterium]
MNSAKATNAHTHIVFRQLREDDLPRLHIWRNQAFIRKWFGGPYSVAEIQAKYLPRIRGEQPTHCYLILIDDVPVGFIQAYAVADYPDHAARLQVSGAVGVDMFIGEAGWIHQGWGSAALRQFVQEVVFGAMGATHCTIGPDPHNHAAIRAYEKAGFRYLKLIPATQTESAEYLMVWDRTTPATKGESLCTP